MALNPNLYDVIFILKNEYFFKDNYFEGVLLAKQKECMEIGQIILSNAASSSLIRLAIIMKECILVTSIQSIYYPSSINDNPI